ncbi:MAG: hypothetical protein P1V13_22110 [Rhizobiaceae bacterium]|nr:hypothetical protein [Rhizobiaceae bacterium]
MGLIKNLGRAAWRKYVTDGVASSGFNAADQIDIFPFVDTLDSYITALQGGGDLQGEWDASAGTFPGSGSATAGQSWIVSVAGTVNGVAFRLGDRVAAITASASTTTYASNWIRLAALLEPVIHEVGNTGSAANAITIETDYAVSDDGGQMVTFLVPITNTSGTVTVAFNDGTALTIKTASGNPPAIGALAAGMPVIGQITNSGAWFQMLSDQATSAIQTACEAAQAYAQEWAQSDDPVSEAAGGDGSTDRSAKYWANSFGTLETVLGWAEEWAQAAEDTPVSEAAGGDGATEYSALHHSAKAADEKTYAEEWAQAAEDTPVSEAAGGDGATDYSALHHSAKASAQRVLAETAKTDAETARDAAADSATDAIANGGLIYDTRSNLNADLDHDANASAWVVADSTQSYMGIYQKSGASGAGSWSRIAPLPLDARVGVYVKTGQTLLVDYTTKLVTTSGTAGAVIWNGYSVSIGASQSVSFTAASATLPLYIYADMTTGNVGACQGTVIPPLNAAVIGYVYNRVLYTSAPNAAISYKDDNSVVHYNYDDEQQLDVAIYYAGQDLEIDMEAGTITTSGDTGFATFGADSVSVTASQNVSIDTTNPTYLRWVLLDKSAGTVSVLKYNSGTPNGVTHALIAMIYGEQLYPLLSEAGSIVYINSSGVSSVETSMTFAEDIHRLLLPPTLHMFSDVPRRLYKTSILTATEYSLLSSIGCNLRTNKSTDIDTDIGFHNDFLLDATALGSSIDIGIRHDNQPDKRYLKSVAISTAPSLSGESINILQIGDSIGEDGLMTEIKAALIDKGASSVTPVGTYSSGASDSLLGEARGYWSYRKFIGKDNYSTGQGAHSIPGAGTTTTKFENPLLKVADGTDKTNYPDLCFRFTGALDETSYTDDGSPETGDFYIFDFANYITSRSVSAPDVIVICLERNDLDLDRSTYSDAQRLSFMRDGLDLMIAKIRDWDADVPIVVVPAYARSSTTSGNTRWAGETASWIENCITDIETLSDSNIHICGAWATMSRDWVFPYSATEDLSSVNDEQVKTITDTVHPDAATSPYYGLRQIAYSIAATVACALP